MAFHLMCFLCSSLKPAKASFVNFNSDNNLVRFEIIVSLSYRISPDYILCPKEKMVTDASGSFFFSKQLKFGHYSTFWNVCLHPTELQIIMSLPFSVVVVTYFKEET